MRPEGAEDENDDNSRDSTASKKDASGSQAEYRDFIVTGGVDDTVKIWDVLPDRSKFKLRNTFTGHSLGVVSVDVSTSGEGKLRRGRTWKGYKMIKHDFICSYREQFARFKPVHMESGNGTADESNFGRAGRFVDGGVFTMR